MPQPHGNFHKTNYLHHVLVLIIIAFSLAGTKAGEQKSLVDYINPIIGASTSSQLGEGKTFPGPATPFGLVQLSPVTITGGDNGPGYSWEHKTIEGFSLTHMSGVGWYGDLENFLVMPTAGKLKTERGVNGAEDGYRSRFHHETEIFQYQLFRQQRDSVHHLSDYEFDKHGRACMDSGADKFL